MTVASTAATKHRAIDMVCPVNWQHPLNRGLVSWWLCVPGLMGGSRLVDLARRNHGTLTNGPTWQGAIGRPGGFGSLRCVATSSQYVNCGQPRGLYSSAACTIMGWGQRDSTSVLWCLGTAGSSSARTEILWFSDGNVYFSVNGISGTYALSGADRHHFAMVFVGSTRMTLFVDGRQVAEHASSIPATTESTATQGNFFVGQTSLSRFTTGWHDDSRVFDYALSASTIWGIVQDSRQGHPLTLNRVRPYPAFDTGAAPGGSNLLSKMQQYGLYASSRAA